MIFSKALAFLLGTLIGAGIFGLPFVALKAGFLILFIYLFSMAFISIGIHLMYARVCLGTVKKHRFPGYVKEYLGDNWSRFSFWVISLGLLGALLSYLIIGGEFLNSVFSSYFGHNPIIYTILFFALGAYLVFKDIRNISHAEQFLISLLFLTFILIFLRALPYINIDNFLKIDAGFLFMPYGVALFSLWASSAVPELKEMFSIYPEKKMRLNLIKVIFWGIILASFVYLFFVFIILGASGDKTSAEAVSGLNSVLGGNIVKLGAVFGILCCFTSYIAIGLTLKKTLWYDIGFSKNISWLIACFFPLIVYFLGARDFIKVIGFTGSVFLGIEGIIIIFLYKGFLRKKIGKKMNPFSYLFAVVFIIGIILETIYFLS